MPEALPPLENLVPHRPPLLLLDEVLAWDPEGCAATARVDPGAWYAAPDGSMPAWFGIELMAQTISAYSGGRRAGTGAPPRLGYLLGTRSYRCALPAFPPGERLEIQVRVHYQDESGLSAFACEIRRSGEPVADAILKVFEEA